MWRFLAVCVAMISMANVHAVNKCKEKRFPGQSFVCVCNSEYCDGIEPNDKIDLPSFSLYTTTKEKERFAKTTLNVKTLPQTESVWVVKRDAQYQTVKGFGGAFTDAASIMISSLPNVTQDKLIAAYFSPTEGIEYTLGKVPMGGTDFSVREYAYADTPNDFGMAGFALAVEDVDYKIPLIKRALSMSSRKVSLFGSPWSAPTWMKTNNAFTGHGRLIGKPGDKYHKAWALYFARFLEEYKKHGLEFWGLTTQNEPLNGLVNNCKWNQMAWTPVSQRDWIALDLGPALEGRGHGNISVMILDDTPLDLPWWASIILENDASAKYVKGIGVHCYGNTFTPPKLLKLTHEKHPDYFILATEASSVSRTGDQPVVMGSWDRGEDYAQDIIQNLNHWAVGSVDSNLALNLEGRPSWAGNYGDAPIIVEKDVFYKQPMYYLLGHFSKFIPEGSTRIEVTPESSGHKELDVVAFLTPEGSVVTVILNRSKEEVDVALHDPDVGYLSLTSQPHSIMTAIWWP